MRGVLPIVYINLERAGERRAFMEAQAHSLGLVLERFVAIDGAALDEETVEIHAKRWERCLTRSEIGLFLSHKALWTRAAASTNGLIILEDDAVLLPRIAEILVAPPRGFDLVNLEHFGRRKFFRRKGQASAGSTRITPVARDKAGSAAYYISPQGAQRLLHRATTLAAPSDAFIHAAPGLARAQAEPALAMQVHLLAARGIDAGTRTVTTIQQPRERTKVNLTNLPFHARRMMTQAKLGLLQARRALDLEFREPTLDEAEFRAILPIGISNQD